MVNPQLNEFNNHSVKIKNKNGEIFQSFDNPDIIVLAEGANSSNAKRVGINSVQTTEARLQMAGEISLNGKGAMAKNFRSESGEQLVAYTMETKNSDKIWVVTDVHANKVDPNPDNFPLEVKDQNLAKGSTEYEARLNELKVNFEKEKSRLTRKEYKRVSSQALRINPHDLENVEISGPLERLKDPSLFFLDQRISSDAISGNNLRMVGDTVGNATPTVGGGMQMGATSHALRSIDLDVNVATIEKKLERGIISKEIAQKNILQARKTYSKNVIDDTLSWHRQGIPDMYLHISPNGAQPKKLSNNSSLAKLIDGDGTSYLNKYNQIVDNLNSEINKIKNMSEMEIKNLTAHPDPYYRIDPRSIFKVYPAYDSNAGEYILDQDGNKQVDLKGIDKYKSKAKKWAYDDYLRKTHDLSIDLWKMNHIDEPVEFLREIIPPRPKEGLEVPRGMKPYENKRYIKKLSPNDSFKNLKLANPCLQYL